MKRKVDNLMFVCVRACVCVSHQEGQHEYAWSSKWLSAGGLFGSHDGEENRGTHNLLQPQRDDADEGNRTILVCIRNGSGHVPYLTHILLFVCVCVYVCV